MKVSKIALSCLLTKDASEKNSGVKAETCQHCDAEFACSHSLGDAMLQPTLLTALVQIHQLQSD